MRLCFYKSKFTLKIYCLNYLTLWIRTSEPTKPPFVRHLAAIFLTLNVSPTNSCWNENSTASDQVFDDFHAADRLNLLGFLSKLKCPLLRKKEAEARPDPSKPYEQGRDSGQFTRVTGPSHTSKALTSVYSVLDQQRPPITSPIIADDSLFSANAVWKVL